MAALPILLALAGFSGLFLYYYESAGDRMCARCHEIRPAVAVWADSSHRSLACSACHGSALTWDLSLHVDNLRRVVRHFSDRSAGKIQLRQKDIDGILERCRGCHRQEYAQWQSGPHAARFGVLFTDSVHDRKRRLVDDCLRCHGMFFPGSIQDLVVPTNLQGPWKMAVPELADRPAMPCMSCHQIHRKGKPLPTESPRIHRSRVNEEISRPSLALFYRRESDHVAIETLPLPAMRQGDRAVKMNPDRRQALCYQCHAPLDTFQVGSGDDRTGSGVHEGIGCLACHQKHGQSTRASCAQCHPRLSNCGRDVEKMDTTFADPQSGHNIHFVACVDCHPKGVPVKPSGR